MKKLFATLLALVMMLSVMSVTAFAVDSYTISVPTDDSHTYAVYQIFTGDLSDGVLSNVKWGANGTGEAGKPVDKDTLKALEDVNADGATNTAKLAEINKLVKFSSSPVATLSASTLSASVPAGYYLIKDSGAVASDDAYTTYIVEIVEDVVISRKANVPTVDKKIVEGESKVSVNEASIGDTVNYEIVGKLPTNLADYNTYFYQFNDTLSKGLTYNKDLKVSVGGVDVTKYFFVNASDYDATNGTTIKVTIADLLALSKLGGVNITKDSEIVLTYSATLNKDAVIAGEGNPNKVDLTYSNNPNQSGEPTTNPPTPPTEEPEPKTPTGKTPEVDVVTFTTELTITKINDKDQILTGAEFQLTGNGVNVMVVTKDSFVEDANGSYWKLKDGSFTTEDPTADGMDQSKYADIITKYSMSTSTEVLGNGQTKTDVKAFVGDDGKLTFTGLGAGTYTLTETTTPAGYNTIAPIEFTVGFQVNEDGTVEFTSDNANVVVGATNTLATTVVNQAGATLPETGGIGTRIFYAVGGILLIGAAVMLVAKKRMDAED